MSGRVLPPHGSEGRYNRERQAGGAGPCMVCKAGHAKRARELRETKRRKDAQRSISAAAGSGFPGLDSDDEATCTVDDGLGPTVRAVLADLNHSNQDVPFFNSLRAALIALAMELDDPKSRAAKGPLVKQITDTIKELKGSGGGEGDSFSDFLKDLAAPLVPTPVLDPEEPE